MFARDNRKNNMFVRNRKKIIFLQGPAKKLFVYKEL